MSSRLSPMPSSMTPFRPESRVSVAASDTTYYTCAYQSFNDVELYAPGSPPSRTPAPLPAPTPAPARVPAPPPALQNHHYIHHFSSKEKQKEKEPEPIEMRRQDSGYESLPPRRASTPSSSQSSSHQQQSQQQQQQQQQQPRSRGRPTIRRAPKTSPYPTAARTSGSSLYHPSSRGHHSSHAPQPATFFHFPAHPTDLELANRRPPARAAADELELDQRGLLSPTQQQQPGGGGSGEGAAEGAAEDAEGAEVAPLPPQATHYWTSDRTRRLEYAAIDAASRGVKGWVKRNLVPDCFVPKEKHVAFDDDTGSVRRYRLELDEETAPGEKAGYEDGRKRSWFGWRRSKTA